MRISAAGIQALARRLERVKQRKLQARQARLGMLPEDEVVVKLEEGAGSDQ